MFQCFFSFKYLNNVGTYNNYLKIFLNILNKIV